MTKAGVPSQTGVLRAKLRFGKERGWEGEEASGVLRAKLSFGKERGGMERVWDGGWGGKRGIP